MKKMRRILLFCALFIIVLILTKFVYSVGVGLQITEFDSDKDGIADSADTDDDNDGVEDSSDTLTGNSSSVKSETIAANVTIGNSINLTQSFTGALDVAIKDANITLANFSFNFSDKTLNLANITIERQNIDNKGSTLVRGITLPAGVTKTLYVDATNTSIDFLCIKDALVDKISDISGDCSGANETHIACPSSGQYNCTKIDGNTRFKVTGLSFSGVRQQPDNIGPVITLDSPRPNSGAIHGNATFIYKANDASDIANCSLIINGKVNATSNTITKNEFMSFNVNNMELGSYNWSVNCTDSLGNIGDSKVRSFSVFLMTNFNESFFNISAINLSNVTYFSVHKGGFGKINFTQNLDLSKGFDINKHITISFNKIKLNTSAIPEFNVTAQLEITGLTLSNPRILIDGNVCPDDICKKVSYSGGVLVFNVTHWTSYEAEETPAGGGSGSTDGGGGGSGSGGGGGGPPAIPVVTDFSLDKTSMKVILKQGETKKETLTIKNIGTTTFDVKAILEEIGKFKIEPAEEEIVTSLSPNEEKTIEFVFKALENEKPEIYPGKITLKSPSKEKGIAAVIEVDSAQPLFDVDVEVLPDSKKVFPGQEVSMEVSLFNVRGFGRVDVEIEYSIKDLKGNVIATEHETLAVETQAKFTRRILVPSYAEPGNYVAFAKVTYADSIGVSSDLFEVQAKAIRLSLVQLKDYRVILGIGAGALLISILIFSAYKFGYIKKKRPTTPAEEVRLIKYEEKTEKLRKELQALESAYKSGFISAESYQKDKKRIEEKLKGLK